MKSRVWRWTAIAAGCALLATGIRAFWLEPASLSVVEERISLRWPMRAPVRMAILTDLHIGSPFNGLAKLRPLVDRTNAARPDVVCILGDLVVQGVIGGRFVAPERIAAELRRLQAPGGVFAVLGNQSALSAVQPDGAPIILLSHNPDVFPDVPDGVALTLAGHTHGGQVRLPFVGRPIVPSRFGQRFAAGHVVEEGRHLFVATGVGTSILPVRFGVPPAVTILTVEPERP